MASTNLPGWIQEMVDEVADITQNPWRVLKGNSLIATRTKMPKLIGLVERMAGMIDCLADELAGTYSLICNAQDRIGCMECGGSRIHADCLVYDALCLHAEYRGEENDGKANSGEANSDG